MQAKIEIEFDQLVNLVKQLPEKQWAKLKSEVEKNVVPSDSGADMLDMLLNGPTFSEKQLEEIAKARKEISEWRKK